MPEPPTSVVKGQVLSVPALQASMSMLSFAPAATNHGWAGSIATAGSFCLFCEKMLSLLPTVTSLSTSWTAYAGSPAPEEHRDRCETEDSGDPPGSPHGGNPPSDGGSVVPGRPPTLGRRRPRCHSPSEGLGCNRRADLIRSVPASSRRSGRWIGDLQAETRPR